MQVKMIESVPKEGKFFQESELIYGSVSAETEAALINVFDEVEYQEILGFGGAFTESAAYNYSKLSDEGKKDFLEKYFDKEKGIGYNFGRTHINSCDFSLDIYSYVEDGDKTLETFSIERDRKYIIPFLKDVLEYCEEELVLFASPWSAPSYMKTNGKSIEGGSIKEEYKKVWALYYAKYIKAYREEGINIGAVSVQNEPKAIQPWESCFYSPEDERDFIEQYLIPCFSEEGLDDIKIIIWDHNKERVYDRAKLILENKKVNERVWAVGHHWYSGDHFEGLSLVQEQLHKPNICTEFCAGINEDVVTVAEKYAREMCQNMNHYTIASCDWNIMLSENGGPYHNRTAESVAVAGQVFESKNGGCYAPVLYNQERNELNYTPIYYYIGHFSKYVKRGAKRIATTKYTDEIYTCAFKNPDNSLVVVILNATDAEKPMHIRHNGFVTPLAVKEHSIATVVMQ